MATREWSERFFDSTRGRVVRLLRRGACTVNELAEALELTDNAVRGHLAALERDGLAIRAGLRRGRGKPAHVYRLTAEAERGFSRAYAPVLGAVLDVIESRGGRADLASVVREAGRRLGAAVSPAGRNGGGRLGAAVAVLEDLGAELDVAETDSCVTIQGHGCPLSELDSQQASACALVEALLAELVGRPVRQACELGDRPRCRFEIAR